MITDYKITEIFCATDEFVRNLMKRLKICLF